MTIETTTEIPSSAHSVVSLNHRFLFLTLSLCHPLVNEEKQETILTSLATNERGALAEASGQSLHESVISKMKAHDPSIFR